MNAAIPPCPVCRRASCVDVGECRRRMVARVDTDEREVRGLSDDLAGFVLSPAGWRAKYGSAA